MCNSFIFKKVRFPGMFKADESVCEVYGCFESPKQCFAAKTPQCPCPAAWEVLLSALLYYLHLIISIFFSV